MIAVQHHDLPISRDTIYLIVITVIHALLCVSNILKTTRRSLRDVRKIHADWDRREAEHIARRDAGLLTMRAHYDASLLAMRGHYDESLASLRASSADSAAEMRRAALGYELVMKRVVRDLGVGALRSAEDYVRELREFIAIIPPPAKTN